MSISITQTCDARCGSTRALKLEYGRGRSDLDVVATERGWIQVDSNKHLCPDCIDRALNLSKETKP